MKRKLQFLWVSSNLLLRWKKKSGFGLLILVSPAPLCSVLPPLYLPQVSPALALSCVFKVIAHGSQGVCIRACHKQSNGMSRGLVHEPNPVSEAKWIVGGVKKLFKRNTKKELVL